MRRELPGISFDISRSKSLLITGVSGVGKTSLLRLLKQLWSPSGGRMERYISYEDIMFLPQNTYLPTGYLFLKGQLLFPRLPSDVVVDDNQIIQVLESLSLSRLLALCGSLDDPVDFEWSEMLSPGEQQRISIARALIRKPNVVVLDEATSGLSEDMERTVYDMLKKYGIFYISIGHRSTLPSYHQKQLRIDCWDLQDLSPQEHF